MIDISQDVAAITLDLKVLNILVKSLKLSHWKKKTNPSCILLMIDIP